VTVAGGVFQFSPTLTELNYGYTYTFDQSDSTNSGHPMRFSTVSDATSGDATSDQATINGIDLSTYGGSSLNPTATSITRARVTNTLIFVKQTMTGYSTGTFGSAQRTEAISVMNGVGTNLTQVEILEVVGGVARTHGITIGVDSLVYEVPNTTPTTMHYYCANHSGMGGNLAVGYPSTTPIPSAYTIHWTDPEELFPSIIDMDTVNQGIVRIQNIFDQTSSRRPGAESLVYDTHMEFVGDQTINSAATGGPTNFPQTYDSGLALWDITGWVEEGRVTWKTLGSMDGLLAFSGRPRNKTELTTAHEIMHALGVGSLNTGTYAINGQDGLVRSYAAGQPSVWLGQHSTDLYETIYANAITDGDVTATPDGVPLKYNDLTLSFTEWFLHRYVMHGNPEALGRFPLIGSPLAKTADTHLEHHKTVQSDMTLKDHQDDNSLIFRIETVLESALFSIPILMLSGQFTLKEAVAVSAVSGLIYSLLWNSIHTKMHGQEVASRWDSTTPVNALAHRNPIYEFLWKYHAVHHVQKGKEKTNYNIILPGMDFIFGTYGGVEVI